MIVGNAKWCLESACFSRSFLLRTRPTTQPMLCLSVLLVWVEEPTGILWNIVKLFSNWGNYTNWPSSTFDCLFGKVWSHVVYHFLDNSIYMFIVKITWDVVPMPTFTVCKSVPHKLCVSLGGIISLCWGKPEQAPHLSVDIPHDQYIFMPRTSFHKEMALLL